jgi:uncharacterized tellurite resistance protein B-like protein
MTTKDYERFAEHIRKADLTDRERTKLVKFLCEIFTEDNTRFNMDLFIKSCREE